MAPVLLLMILALAPALDLAGDGRGAVLPTGPAAAPDLCTVPGLTPPPPVLAPVIAIARVTDTATAGPASPLARPVDHAPRSA